MKKIESFERIGQQGDVVLKKVDTLPEKLKRLNHLTLAEGEVTGHAHRLSGGAARLFEDDSRNMYLTVEKATVLTHETHGHVAVAPGKYKVGKIREYNSFLEEAQAVKD